MRRDVREEIWGWIPREGEERELTVRMMRQGTKDRRERKRRVWGAGISSRGGFAGSSPIGGCAGVEMSERESEQLTSEWYVLHIYIYIYIYMYIHI